MFRQKLYQATLNFCKVNVMAFDLEDATLCVQEMHPNSSILSIVEIPLNYFEDLYE